MGEIEAALCADLERWGAEVAGSALAAVALDLSRRLDEPGVRPAAAAMLHAQLRVTLADLERHAPVQAAGDGVDELSAQRDARRKAAGLA